MGVNGRSFRLGARRLKRCGYRCRSGLEELAGDGKDLFVISGVVLTDDFADFGIVLESGFCGIEAEFVSVEFEAFFGEGGAPVGDGSILFGDTDVIAFEIVSLLSVYPVAELAKGVWVQRSGREAEGAGVSGLLGERKEPTRERAVGVLSFGDVLQVKVGRVAREEPMEAAQVSGHAEAFRFGQGEALQCF